MVIHWYPGHMAKAMATVKDNLKLVDLVIEIVDARIPESSANPNLREIIKEKPRLIALNKADLAVTEVTKRWIQHYKSTYNVTAVPIEANSGKGIQALIRMTHSMMKEKMDALVERGRNVRAVRALIVGIPNVGKSSLINRLAGTGIVKTADKPGVTRGKQWIRIGKDFELLDTPGVLWPKFEDQEAAFRLAATGAISDEVLHVEKLVLKLVQVLQSEYPYTLKERFKLSELPDEPEEVIKLVGQRRGCLKAGGIVDQEKATRIILQEFRSGKLGPITLDMPPEMN